MIRDLPAVVAEMFPLPVRLWRSTHHPGFRPGQVWCYEDGQTVTIVGFSPVRGFLVAGDRLEGDLSWVVVAELWHVLADAWLVVDSARPDVVPWRSTGN